MGVVWTDPRLVKEVIRALGLEAASPAEQQPSAGEDNEESIDLELGQEHVPCGRGEVELLSIETFRQSWSLKHRNRRHRFSKTVFGEGECVDRESTTAGTQVNSSWTHGVLSVEEIRVLQACAVVNVKTGGF